MEGEIQQKSFQPIDIRNVVRGKNPKIAKKIPGFVYNYFSKILHLKEWNEFLKLHGDLTGAEFVDAFLKSHNIQYEFIGTENIPGDQKFIFVSNHPLGGADGGIILKFMNENLGVSKCLTNDFLMELTPLSNWFIPINKLGGQSRNSIDRIEQLYLSDDQILIFPAGLCSRKIKGKIVDLQWQKHFIQKAVQYKIDIIPIFFEGRNSNFFYNLANIRKFLKIKFNIEMIYLVDELFKHENHTFKIYFGKPIPYTTFDHFKKPIDWAKEVKRIAYQIPQTICK